MATKQIRKKLTEIIKNHFPSQSKIKYLDIGAGKGGFTKQIKEACSLDATACDLMNWRNMAFRAF